MKNGLLRLGRRGVPHLEPGKMLYYLWHEPTGLYYIDCYTNQKYAIKKAGYLTGPRDMNDVSMSWRAEMKQCQHSFRTED